MFQLDSFLVGQCPAKLSAHRKGLYIFGKQCPQPGAFQYAANQFQFSVDCRVGHAFPLALSNVMVQHLGRYPPKWKTTQLWLQDAASFFFSLCRLWGDSWLTVLAIGIKCDAKSELHKRRPRMGPSSLASPGREGLFPWRLPLGGRQFREAICSAYRSQRSGTTIRSRAYKCSFTSLLEKAACSYASTAPCSALCCQLLSSCSTSRRISSRSGIRARIDEISACTF